MKNWSSNDGQLRVTSQRRALGAYGEKLVGLWYEDRGYTVVDRNWRCREGEIDLVAIRGRLVVICEVKTRSSNAYGSPASAVTIAKQSRLRVLALRWLDDQNLRSVSLRFDVACVIGQKIDVIESAF